MGLILDSGLMIRAEHLKLSVLQATELWLGSFDESEVDISVITLAELAHGIARAKSDKQRASRMAFVDGIRAVLPVYPIGEEIALRAGILDGELHKIGFSIGLADTIIAATALVRGDGVATLNHQHFRLVPGLNVVEM